MDFASILVLQTEASFASLLCCIVLGSFILWLIVGIWVYRDAESRGMNGVLWLLVVLVAGLIGIIIYFVVRHDRRPPLYPAYVPPPWTPTPALAQAMPGATPLTCKNCGAALATGATFCSKCGTKV